MGQGNVLINGRVEEEPLFTGFDDVRNARVDALPRGAFGQRLAVQEHLPLVVLPEAENGLPQFEMPGAYQTVDAENLPPTQVEGDVLEHAVLGQMAHREHHLVGLRLLHHHLPLVRFLEEGHLFAQDQADQLVLRRFRRGQRGDLLAVAQHRNAVRHLHDLFQEVGDVNDAVSLPGQFADQLQQAFRLLGGKGRSGLVHDEHLGARGDDAGDLHQLVHAQGILFQSFTHIQGKSQALERRVRLREHPLPIHNPCGRRGLAAQENVLRDGEHGHDAQFLVDHGNAVIQRVLGGMELYGTPLPIHLPAIRSVHAREDAHQGGLPRAVLPHDGVHFPRTQIKIHTFEGMDSAEPFVDVLQFE